VRSIPASSSSSCSPSYNFHLQLSPYLALMVVALMVVALMVVALMVVAALMVVVALMVVAAELDPFQ
jgi:uncharacterized membrane protein